MKYIWIVLCLLTFLGCTDPAEPPPGPPDAKPQELIRPSVQDAGNETVVQPDDAGFTAPIIPSDAGQYTPEENQDAGVATDSGSVDFTMDA